MPLQIFPDINSRFAISIAENNWPKIFVLLRHLDLSESRNNPYRSEDILGWRAYKQLGDAVKPKVLDQLIQQAEFSGIKK